MFIETWAFRISSMKKPFAWSFGSPPPDSRTRRAIRLASSRSGAVEVDVVGDQERPRPDRDGAGRRVHPRRPEVRLAAVLADLGLQALVLAAPDVGELDPVAAPRRLGVEVDRQVEALGDPRPERPGQLDRLVHRRVGQRHERDDVDGPDPGVLAPVLVHVDLADRRRDELLEGVATRRRPARPG